MVIFIYNVCSALGLCLMALFLLYACHCLRKQWCTMGLSSARNSKTGKMAMREDSLLDSPVSYNSFQRSVPLRASKVTIGNIFLFW